MPMAVDIGFTATISEMSNNTAYDIKNYTWMTV